MDALSIKFADEPSNLTIDFDAQPARGLGAAFTAGWQGSAPGLMLRGRLPDVVLSPGDSKWYERAAAGVAQIGAELPFGVVGAVAGAIGGGAAGSVVAPGPGTAVGGLLGAGAGSFAVPAAIRESYIQALSKGEIASTGDFLDRAQIVLRQTGKEALIGAATAGAGKVAQIGATAAGLGAKATGAAVLTAEGGTLVVAPAALEGRMPEPQDFLDAAILLVGFKGATVAAGRLRETYAKAGKTPAEVLADAKNDSTIAEDLKAAAKPAAALEAEIPRAYQEQARQENARRAVPDPSPEAAQFLEKPFAEVPQLPGEPVLKTHVNYNHLNTTPEVMGAMSRLSELYEAQIREATRGTVGWEQTYAEARDLYRKTTGEEPPPAPLTNADYVKLSADLYARKQILVSGAEQLLVQQKAYVEARAQGLATDQMKLELLAQIDRVAQAQAAVRGSQAEVGRALNVLRSTNRDKAYYDELADIINGRFGGGGVKTELVKRDFDALVDALGAMETPSEALGFARKAKQATKLDMAVEAYKAGLVSGYRTQLANLLGNATFLAARPFVDLTAVAFSTARSGPERMSAVEPLARVVGNIHGLVDAARVAARVLRTGEQYGAAPDRRLNAIPGVAGEVVRLPFRGLAAGDGFFRVLNERGEAFTLASRQAAKEGLNPATREFRERVADLASNPTDKMIDQIDAAGARGTFNAPLGDIGRNVQALLNAAPALKFFIPFVQTPANVLKEMLRLTPFAPVIKEWRKDFAAGGVARDKALAEITIGIAFSSAMAMFAMSGRVSGQGDPDPNKRRTQMASGWQPYSIQIEDTWYSYQRIQPIGTLIGMAADAVAVAEHMTPEEQDRVPKILATAFANAVTNQTFLQGLTNIINVGSDPNRYAGRFWENFVASWVPGAVGQTAQTLDPYQREIYGVLDAVKARIPGLSETLQPKRDPYGEPIPSKDYLAGISPIATSTMSQDKVRLEATRLGVGVAKAPDYIELPAGRDPKLGRVELTPEQRDVFATEAGKLAYRILSQMVNSPTWDNLPDMAQRNAMAKAFEASRAMGKAAAVPPDQLQREAERIAKELRIRLQPK